MEHKPKLLPIRIYGDSILRVKVRPVEVFDEKLKQFVSDLTYTMYRRDGVGLAANQAGENLRLFVIDTQWSQEGAEPKPVVMINPVIEAGEGEIEMEEGCLSLPGIYAKVKRFDRIRYSYFDADGKQHFEEAEGFRAVVIQHEYDHLNGILFIDRIGKLSLLKLKLKLRELERTAVDGVNVRTDIFNPHAKRKG